MGSGLIKGLKFVLLQHNILTAGPKTSYCFGIAKGNTVKNRDGRAAVSFCSDMYRESERRFPLFVYGCF